MLPYQVLQFVALVLLALYRQTAAQGGGNLHLIITIDAKNVFHHVAWTLHVHPIGRDYERQAISILLSDLHFQTGHYTADGLGRNMLTDEGIHIGILEIHGESLHRLWTCISYLHAHLGSCQLFGHEGSSLEGIDLSIGVHTALKTETGIGAQSMTASTLAYPCGIEISTLKYHIASGLIRTTTLSAKHSGYAHGLLGIADGQVAVREFMLHSVEGDKRGTLGHGLDHYLMSLDHICIKAVKRCAKGHHDVIGDIHDIVDGTYAYDTQTVLQPLGTLLYLTASETDCCISGTGFLILHHDLDGQTFVIYLESIHRRFLQLSLISVLKEPGIEVACHTIMTACICTVGGNIHFYDVIALDVIILSGRYAHWCVLGKNDDAAMVITHTYLILGTYHTATFHAAQLASLYGKALIAIIELGTHHGHYHLLACCHIGSSAYYLQRLTLAGIHLADVHMIAVGMNFTGEHMGCPETFQSSFNRLNFLHTIYFQTDAGESVGHFMSVECGIHILAKPLVRYIHFIYILYCYCPYCALQPAKLRYFFKNRRICPQESCGSAEPVFSLCDTERKGSSCDYQREQHEGLIQSKSLSLFFRASSMLSWDVGVATCWRKHSWFCLNSSTASSARAGFMNRAAIRAA